MVLYDWHWWLWSFVSVIEIKVIRFESPFCERILVFSSVFPFFSPLSLSAPKRNKGCVTVSWYHLFSVGFPVVFFVYLMFYLFAVLGLVNILCLFCSLAICCYLEAYCIYTYIYLSLLQSGCSRIYIKYLCIVSGCVITVLQNTCTLVLITVS